MAAMSSFSHMGSMSASMGRHSILYDNWNYRSSLVDDRI